MKWWWAAIGSESEFLCWATTEGKARQRDKSGVTEELGNCDRQRLHTLAFWNDQAQEEPRRCLGRRVKVSAAMSMVSLTKVVLPSVLASFAVSYAFWDLSRNRKIFGGESYYSVAFSLLSLILCWLDFECCIVDLLVPESLMRQGDQVVLNTPHPATRIWLFLDFSSVFVLCVAFLWLFLRFSSFIGEKQKLDILFRLDSHFCAGAWETLVDAYSF